MINAVTHRRDISGNEIKFNPAQTAIIETFHFADLRRSTFAGIVNQIKIDNTTFRKADVAWSCVAPVPAERIEYNQRDTFAFRVDILQQSGKSRLNHFVHEPA